LTSEHRQQLYARQTVMETEKSKLLQELMVAQHELDKCQQQLQAVQQECEVEVEALNQRWRRVEEEWQDQHQGEVHQLEEQEHKVRQHLATLTKTHDAAVRDQQLERRRLLLLERECDSLRARTMKFDALNTAVDWAAIAAASSTSSPTTSSTSTSPSSTASLASSTSIKGSTTVTTAQPQLQPEAVEIENEIIQQQHRRISFYEDQLKEADACVIQCKQTWQSSSTLLMRDVTSMEQELLSLRRELALAVSGATRDHTAYMTLTAELDSSKAVAVTTTKTMNARHQQLEQKLLEKQVGLVDAMNKVSELQQQIKDREEDSVSKSTTDSNCSGSASSGSTRRPQLLLAKLGSLWITNKSNHANNSTSVKEAEQYKHRDEKKTVIE
jgi:hypothetical protein